MGRKKNTGTASQKNSTPLGKEGKEKRESMENKCGGLEEDKHTAS